MPKIISNPQCPVCQSTNWSCWDDEPLYSEEDDTLFQTGSIGYLSCKDCGAQFADIMGYGDTQSDLDGDEDWSRL